MEWGVDIELTLVYTCIVSFANTAEFPFTLVTIQFAKIKFKPYINTYTAIKNPYMRFEIFCTGFDHFGRCREEPWGRNNLRRPGFLCVETLCVLWKIHPRTDLQLSGEDQRPDEDQ